MPTLIAAVTLSIVISALCSLLESVLYSTRAITLEAAAESGDRWAQSMQTFKRQVDRPLSAILILNTVANTAGAALAGWAAGEVWGPGSLWSFSLVFTAAILIFSEIVPKTVGAIHWRTLWRPSIWPLQVMTASLGPLIWAARGLTRIITGRQPTATLVSEDEILAAARLGARGGEITSREHELIHNIIQLENVRAADIMTPRTVMLTVDGDLSVGEVALEAGQWPYSRVPVYVGGPEEMVGYVTKDQILGARETEHAKAIKAMAKPLAYWPGSVNALNLLDAFLRQRQHLGLVVDEYGGIMGLITLEDVLESLVGAEIVDETDQVEDLQKLARRRGRTFMDSTREGNE